PTQRPAHSFRSLRESRTSCRQGSSSLLAKSSSGAGGRARSVRGKYASDPRYWGSRELTPLPSIRGPDARFRQTDERGGSGGPGRRPLLGKSGLGVDGQGSRQVERDGGGRCEPRATVGIRLPPG